MSDTPEFPIVEQLLDATATHGHITAGFKGPLHDLVVEATAVLREALHLLALFHVYDSVPDDHGYVGSTLENRLSVLFDRINVELVPTPSGGPTPTRG